MDRQFPPEIIEIIFHASLPPPDSSVSAPLPKSRYRTLKTFSLLNSAWREIARPSLYEWVVLESATTMEQFMQTIEGAGGVETAVRSLTCRIQPGPSLGATRKLLRCVPLLENLALGPGYVDIAGLAGLQHLRRLEISCTRLLGLSSTRSLACVRLKDLRMDMAHIDPSAFTTAFLPAVRYLDTTAFDSRLPSSLAQQIDGIRMKSPSPRLLGARSSGLKKSLLLLQISDSSDVHDVVVMRLLDPLPPFLLVDHEDPAEASKTVTQILEESSTRNKKGLRVVFLRIANRGELQRNLQSMIEKLEQGGVRVERHEGALGLFGAAARMEEILAKEKRVAEDVASG